MNTIDVLFRSWEPFLSFGDATFSDCALRFHGAVLWGRGMRMSMRVREMQTCMLVGMHVVQCALTKWLVIIQSTPSANMATH